MSQLYGELLTQLVDERLLEQEARKLSITVSSNDVERAIDNVRRQSGLDDPGFWEAVEGQGFTRDQYQADVRRQLLRLKVVNQKVRSRINVTEDDVRRRYDQMLRSARRSARFNVAHVFLSVDSGSATKLAEAKARADALRATLTPQSFDQAMAEHGGGELGWIEQKDIPAVLADALLSLEPGQIGPPVRGPSGIHIFFLRDRKEGGEAAPSYDEVKNDIYREMVDQAMAKQEVAYLEELRKQSLIARKL
jgi:peptidyl-prolyl cis-trans isomerase SurA